VLGRPDTVTLGVLGAVGVGSGPLLYAFTLGLVAAVNPCGFPLLPAYLSLFVAEDADARSRRNLRALGAGAGVAAGFVVVFGLLGILVQGGIDVVVGWVPWVMIPVGLAMVGIGVAAATGRSIRLLRPMPRLGTGRGVLAMAGFGVTYAVASLSCALPLFLAAVAGSFGRLGFVDGTGTFVAYALGMGLFLMVAGLVIANAGVSALRRVRPLTRVVPRLAGAVLALVGAYLVFYWAAFVADPTATPQPIGLVEHVQAVLTGWLSQSPRVIGLVLGLVVVVVIGLATLARPRHPERPAPRAVAAAAPREPVSGRTGG
jgi:cytochrome c biogenesis protein CcdA